MPSGITLKTKPIFFIVIFSFKDLPEHIEKNPKEWQVFCQSSKVSETLPSPWDKLEPIEQVLVIKHLKPDFFASSMTAS